MKMMIEGRKSTRWVTTSTIKPFLVRPPDVRHHMIIAFAEYIRRGADLGLSESLIVATL